MPLSEYVADLRGRIGHRLLLLPGVTAVITDIQGRYLLARHVNDGRWGFVGGGVEPGEEPKDALRREVREEFGADADILDVLDSYGGESLVTTYPNGDVVSYVTTAYLCRLRSEPRAAEPEEVSEVAWFTVQQIAALDRAPWIDRVIIDAETQRHPASEPGP